MRLGSWIAATRKAHCHSKRKPLPHCGRAVSERERSVVREFEAKEGATG